MLGRLMVKVNKIQGYRRGTQPFLGLEGGEPLPPTGVETTWPRPLQLTAAQPSFCAGCDSSIRGRVLQDWHAGAATATVTPAVTRAACPQPHHRGHSPVTALRRLLKGPL